MTSGWCSANIIFADFKVVFLSNSYGLLNHRLTHMWRPLWQWISLYSRSLSGRMFLGLRKSPEKTDHRQWIHWTSRTTGTTLTSCFAGNIFTWNWNLTPSTITALILQQRSYFPYLVYIPASVIACARHPTLVHPVEDRLEMESQMDIHQQHLVQHLVYNENMWCL